MNRASPEAFDKATLANLVLRQAERIAALAAAGLAVALPLLAAFAELGAATELGRDGAAV